MPHPLVGIAALVALYAFCLLLSYFFTFIYDKRESKDKKEDDEERVFRIESPRKRRRKRLKKPTVIIRGRIIDDQTENGSEF